MKQIIPIILIVLIHSTTAGQNQDKKQSWNEVIKNWDEWAAKRRKEVRLSNDPFYQHGDTLYLIYDPTDSLQVRKNGVDIQWLLRVPTPEEEERARKYETEIIYCIRFSPFPKNRKRIILPREDVKKLVPATRKEFMDFYKREMIRTQNEYIKTKNKRHIFILEAWPLDAYFEKTFMIIPVENGKFVMYEATNVIYE